MALSVHLKSLRKFGKNGRRRRRKRKPHARPMKSDIGPTRSNATTMGGGPEVPAYGQMRQAVGVPGQPPQHPQLPPIGYQPAASGNTAAPQYGTQSPGLPEGMAQYATPSSNAYNSPNSNSSSYPQSPYGQNPQMYQQNH
ncbi:transcriptional regulator [Pyrenophora seminiperda CCB06]|uniref:Transcriptional regulator n=1 Tax=Pyrenophora seminiperda CCB06 TaxID=1302712 RepID=A0A3M7MAL0_9PLEO|nr:transcriptional regulator [Pyrenophora seminiperda CCB06]